SGPSLVAPPARRRRWAVAAASSVVGVAAALAVVGARSWSPGTPAVPVADPAYTRLTFRRGPISRARFTSDGGAVYSAAWDGAPMALWTTVPGRPESRPTGITARLASVSRAGELAIILGPARRPGSATQAAPHRALPGGHDAARYRARRPRADDARRSLHVRRRPRRRRRAARSRLARRLRARVAVARRPHRPAHREQRG